MRLWWSAEIGRRGIGVLRKSILNRFMNKGECFFQISATELIIVQCNGADPMFQSRDANNSSYEQFFAQTKG